MPFSRPTLTQIKQDVAADLRAANPDLLRVSNLGIITQAQAIQSNGHYGYLDWIARQATLASATDPNVILEHGAIRGLTLNPAVAAMVQVQFTGINGTDLSANSPVSRNETGDQYTTTADATVVGAVVTVTVLAAVEGAAQTPLLGEPMTLGSGIAGITAASGVVTSIVTPGADVEDVIDSYKPRALAAYAAPPQGGAWSNYIGWALEVSGVTRAWVTPNGMGAGTVVVYVMLDESESVDGGFPQGSNGVSQFDMGPGGAPRATVASGDQLTVADYICSGRALTKGACQPVTALVYVCAPISTAQNFTIAGTSSWSTATKAAASAAIAGVLLRKGGPGGALDIGRNVKGTIALSDIESAIAAVPLTEGFVIQSPTANLTSTTGQLLVLGTITWAA